VSLSANIEDYEFEESIGEGNFGNVFKCKYLPLGQTVAIKKIRKTPVNSGMVEREIRAGKLLSNPNVAKFYQQFEDAVFNYLVFEFVEGIELFSLMEQRNFEPLEESAARIMFSQLVKTISNAHTQGIAHMDLKMENLLINQKTNKATVIDFGLCYFIKADEACDSWVGSVDYICPEVILRKPYCARKGDVWSLATNLYILVCGEIPFSKRDRYEALGKGRHPAIDYPPHLKLSRSLKDLLRSMFAFNPQERSSIEDVLNHEWMRTEAAGDVDSQAS